MTTKRQKDKQRKKAIINKERTYKCKPIADYFKLRRKRKKKIRQTKIGASCSYQIIVLFSLKGEKTL